MNTQESAIASDKDPAVAEIDVTRAVYHELKKLPSEAQTRVISHVSGMLAIKVDRQPHHQQQQESQADQGNGNEGNGAELQREQTQAPKFATFAHLFEASGPTTNRQKALVAGYWLQVCQNANTFDGFTANKELKNLGERLPNITVAIDALRREKPSLALQLNKSGSSKQARKTYKLTVPGIKAVEAMING
jgi:hypothetical protein